MEFKGNFNPNGVEITPADREEYYYLRDNIEADLNDHFAKSARVGISVYERGKDGIIRYEMFFQPVEYKEKGKGRHPYFYVPMTIIRGTATCIEIISNQLRDVSGAYNADGFVMNFILQLMIHKGKEDIELPSKSTNEGCTDFLLDFLPAFIRQHGGQEFINSIKARKWEMINPENELEYIDENSALDACPSFPPTMNLFQKIINIPIEAGEEGPLNYLLEQWKKPRTYTVIKGGYQACDEDDINGPEDIDKEDEDDYIMTGSKRKKRKGAKHA